MKLYRVRLKGMQGTFGCDIAYGNPYVVADNPTEAENIVRDYLTENEIGFSGDRELESITLLAEEALYPNCKIQLFIKGRDYEAR